MGRIYNYQIIEQKIRYELLSIPALIVAGMFFCASLFSCENDLSQVKTVTATDSTPDQIVNGMHTLYSDSGIVRFEIIANRMEKYDGEREMTIFKNGFQVNFFKGKDVIESHLEADYGEMRPREKIIVCRNNVIFTNYLENQTLKTEELKWLQSTKRIVTDKQFEVFGKDDYYVRGVGLDSDENFRDYEMHDVIVEYYNKNE
ncbi:LPS export ABC transporter periplasmic protein LptC [Paracrocinitomix mangrovi]|uniref:LPS export ABC transporter periplasmic protein LptC n=1 Tax=Paracrocinitomix mangrovi TaxID=2862509 RepID=UPI001C8D7B0E|nr:LPS export ABC transporter periplasmic protein LptC [Paracrocinitomix mangrovi]UKN00158.1 LPS export ABC transporter periplasmic protein LptC [Paracrocinitomix mangrovi]